MTKYNWCFACLCISFIECSKNNPEVLAKRKERVAQLDNDIKRMQTHNPGKKPEWNEQRVMLMDRTALELGKRCIMWDDAGSGFFLVSQRNSSNLSSFTRKIYII